MILILFLAYCTENIGNIMILYGAVMIHEAAHFVSCLVLKEKVAEIRFMPYGVNLRIKGIKNPLHTMIISVSGPLASLVMIFAFKTTSSEAMNVFRISNIAIFVLNMFPALPLDGGTFLEGILTYKTGYIRAHRKMMEITRIASIVFAILGTIFLLISKYNISLLVISGFLMYNLKEERKKYIFLRQMIYTKEFDRSAKKLRIKHTAVCENVTAVSLTDCLGYNYICHFFVYDADMVLIGTLTQAEVLDGIIAYGADVTMGRLASQLNGGTNEHKGKCAENTAEGI